MKIKGVVGEDYHWLPGRLRLRVDGLKDNPGLANKLERSWVSIPGGQG